MRFAQMILAAAFTLGQAAPALAARTEAEVLQALTADREAVLDAGAQQAAARANLDEATAAGDAEGVAAAQADLAAANEARAQALAELVKDTNDIPKH